MEINLSGFFFFNKVHQKSNLRLHIKGNVTVWTINLHALVLACRYNEFGKIIIYDYVQM